MHVSTDLGEGDGPGPLPTACAAVSLLCFCLLVLVVAPALVVHEWNDWWANEAARHAMADPSFVSEAAEAGFRVERSSRSGWPSVLARCARSNEAGPLPCGPFPASPAHPGLRVEVLG